MKPDLSVNLNGLQLDNPVMVASGTFGYGQEFSDLIDLNKLGAIMVKGTTLKPRPGNPMPRMVETRSGCLNAIGLQNPGIDAFLSEKLPFLRQYGCKVIVNIGADNKEEYPILASMLDGQQGVDAIELNISCPNQQKGGLQFGIDPDAIVEVVASVKEKSSLPLIVKLSPNVTDITATAKAAVKGGADILSLVNTFTGTAIDAKSRKFRIANLQAGLSGPCIKPIALLMVYKVAQVVDIPIIGMGGIMDATDAIEFMLAGASAVALGTVNYVNPLASMEVISGIEEYLVSQGESSVKNIVGTVERI